MHVRALAEGQEIDQVLLVKAVERRAGRDGHEYLRLTLGDRTGTVTGMVWDEMAIAAEVLHAGAAVHVCGRLMVHPRHGRQIVVSAVRSPANGSFSPVELVDGPVRAPEQMESDLRELVATVQQPHLRRLLEEVFGEGLPTWDAYRRAPAAKYYHQAYAHGLLEHCLSVAQSVSAISAMFPGIDRDVAVTGALLHDIGKLEAYRDAPEAIDLTDAGRLHGEIALGYYRIRRLTEQIEGFPPSLAMALTHIILSHHGTLEYGSPVVPCTREATLVHMIDNLGGRLGSFDRIEKALGEGQQWSAYDRAIGAEAWFAPRESALEQRRAA
ncbi:MAG TPA: HD domain-containing protein [Solirubrobacteraceae bacterium]|jgi:3'-5' exoribonuclease|nr:HD domain-containing protein [Solirubrobacteraceae bacterium]